MPSTQLVLFGDPECQDILLSIFREGQLDRRQHNHVPIALRRSGLIGRAVDGGKVTYVIENRHPAIDTIRALLERIDGGPGKPAKLCPEAGSAYAVDVSQPLAHPTANGFRLLLQLVREELPLSEEELRRRVPRAWSRSLRKDLQRLILDGVVLYENALYTVSGSVPHEYRTLILDLAKILTKRDPGLAENAGLKVPRVSAFKRNVDEAPRIFGSDIRLRNLMALAKHGAVYTRDLRQLTGVVRKFEERDNAPFGRAGLVRTWMTSEENAVVDIDPALPIYYPLRRYLRRVEEHHPLPAFALRDELPEAPPPRPWKGDKHALFGGELKTSILISIGALGWTCESICVALCGSYDRVVVKKALRELENDGILAADRKRRPGFNVRILKLSPSCTARDELEFLLKACASAWPTFTKRMEVVLQQLSPRTKVHLRKRGISLEPIRPVPVDRYRRLKSITPEHRNQLMFRYYALSTAQLRPLASNEVLKLDSNLYGSIRMCWPNFAEFRKEAGLDPKLDSAYRKRNPRLREWCVARYFKMADTLGYYPNTAEIADHDVVLNERILIQWGSFPKFCEDLKVFPARRHRTVTADADVARERCRAEYRAIAQHLGHPPSSKELSRHTDGLQKRIAKLWGGFTTFRREEGVVLARHICSK